MLRRVSCVETSTNTMVEEHLCSSASKPASENHCMQTPCTGSYVLEISLLTANLLLLLLLLLHLLLLLLLLLLLQKHV